MKKGACLLRSTRPFGRSIYAAAMAWRSRAGATS
jgi:hypothetical protein